MTIANRFPGATIIESPWWGYPTVGAPRRVRATILAVDHITDGLSNAADTTRWGITTKNRSWTFCIDRNGAVVQSLDPVLHVPWTNGDVNQPNLANPRIVAAVNSGLNLNEWVFATIECVGRPDGWPITDAQRESLRRIHLWARDLSGLPLNRETVIGHYEINSVGRANCPTLPRDRAQFWIDVIPATLPDTATEDDMTWKEIAEQRLDRIKALEARRDTLLARVAELSTVNTDLAARLRDCEGLSEHRRKRITVLEGRRDSLLTQVSALEDEVEALTALGVPELKATIEQLRSRLKRIRDLATDPPDEA